MANIKEAERQSLYRRLCCPIVPAVRAAPHTINPFLCYLFVYVDSEQPYPDGIVFIVSLEDEKEGEKQQNENARYSDVMTSLQRNIKKKIYEVI